MPNNNFDLKKRSYYFSLEIIKFINTLPNQKVCWVIINQLLRSATSIGANIIEAKGGSSKKDFINFYHHSLKSANETKYWLGLLRDSKLGNKEKTEKLLQEADELAKMLAASILTMKNKR